MKARSLITGDLHNTVLITPRSDAGMFKKNNNSTARIVCMDIACTFMLQMAIGFAILKFYVSCMVYVHFMYHTW